MDVVRISPRPRTDALRRRALAVAAVAAVVAAGIWTIPPLLARHGAEPALERDSLTIDTVTRGTLEPSVTAAGTLVPDRVHVVATAADGIVAELPVRAGTRVAAGTVIARLENPDLRVAVADAAAELSAARANVASAREENAAIRLDEQSVLRSARAEDMRADAEAASDSSLHDRGLIGDLQYRDAIIKRGEDRDLLRIAGSKIAVGGAEGTAKIAAAQAVVDQLSATLSAKRAQEATLVVRAGAAGVVQSVAIDPGQRVASGAELARVADERDLKAVLAVAESDMRGVASGLPAAIVSSDGTAIAGRVARIAPTATNGTVPVDVALDRLPQNARADQNVDGTIVLARIPNALSIARPASTSDAATVALYRLDAGGTHAYRTTVRLGAGSDDRARVLSGLSAGDRVIVSDTSAEDAPILRIR